MPGASAPPWSEKRTASLKVIGKEGLQGGKGDNHWGGRPRHIHAPGIQQEPPLIVDGQVHGGIAQGLGQALYEEVVYDAHGQLVTGSLLDYTVPKASMLPPLETARTVTPTLLNPLGAKGVGEAGTSGSAAAVANAIIDALAPFGVTHLEMPLKPEKLWRLMHHGTHAGTSDRPASAATRG
jgi:xanthine dehydrogenase molybdopterin-binding subunit B